MIIRIRNGQAVAAVDTAGAQLTSYQDSDHKEYVWDQNPAYWGSSSPILFPMISNLRECGTEMEGKMYPLTRHGVVRYAEYAVTARSADSVTLCTTSNEETLKVYPYAFALYITFSLVGEALKVEMKVENTDDKTMYYHIGGHPAFYCPMERGEKFEDYVIKFACKENLYSPVYNIHTLQVEHDHLEHHLDNSDTIPLNYSLFDSDAMIFTNMKSPYVSVLNPATGKGIRFTPSNFETVAFWSPIGKKAPFICIEPWNGSAIWDTDDNVFAHKKGICSLEAGKSECYSYVVEPERP